MFKIAFIVILLSLCSCSGCSAMQMLCEIEAAGKIVDQDGKLITDEVVLTAELESWDYPLYWDPKAGNFSEQIKTDTKTLEKKVYGGTFSWKFPDANTCDIRATKDGYHGDRIRLEEKDDKLIAKDLIIHLVKKGIPSKLEYVENAIIPSKKNKKSNGKDCGWSFKKLWYSPVGEEETIWMTRTVDEEGKTIYTMKEPGGFVYFPGYPQRESAPDKLQAWFDWMPQAPEDGYIQSIRPADHKGNVGSGEIYYYFKTPDEKYGKICFHGAFDYYLQPDGSHNLEAGEVDEVGPVRPEYLGR